MLLRGGEIAVLDSRGNFWRIFFPLVSHYSKGCLRVGTLGILV